MRRYLPVTAVFWIVSAMLMAACGNSTPVNPTIKVEQIQETDFPTVSPTPEITATPTQAPPIPCTISFESDRDGNQEIYRMAPDGSQTMNLTNNPAYDVEPAWSPDGSQIAFVSNRPTIDEIGGNYIFVMDADGSNPRQLTLDNESSGPDWSPDGSQITYSNSGDIYVIRADGSGQSTNLTNTSDQDEQPTWSPDGRHIAWLSGENGRWNIFVMNNDGSNVMKLTENGKANNVLWTVDGEIFSHWDHPDGVCFNCVMNADGSNIRQAGGKGEIQQYLPYKTLDGDRVECISGNFNTGNEEIYLVSDIYPDVFLNLTNNPGNDRNPDWPDKCLAGFGKVLPEESAVPLPEDTDSPNELVFGYAGDEPSQWQRKNNFQKACEELAIPYVYGEIPDLLNQNVSAIVLNSSPDTIQSFAASIRKANEMGIPVFVLDAELNGDGIYSVMADRDEMIKVTLNNLLKKSGRSGDFAYFDFDPTQKDAKVIKGLLEKDYPQIKVVSTDAARYNFKDDEFILNDLIEAYPNLLAIWTNSGYTNAVFSIVNNIKSPGKYPMINCEPSKTGFFIWKDRTLEHPGFECVIVSNPPGIAYDAVYAAYYLVSGEKIDESALGGEYGNAFMADFPVITNENLAEWMKIVNFEKDDFVADQLMSPEEIKGKWFQ